MFDLETIMFYPPGYWNPGLVEGFPEKADQFTELFEPEIGRFTLEVTHAQKKKGVFVARETHVVPITFHYRCGSRGELLFHMGAVKTQRGILDKLQENMHIVTNVFDELKEYYGRKSTATRSLDVGMPLYLMK